MFFDNFAIPKDAKNVAEAHAFIDYMLRPEVAAKNSNFLGYANGNIASQPLLDKAVFEDRTVYPDAATMASLYLITAHDQKTQRLLNRLWTKDQDRAVDRCYSSRHLRCSHSHCSGCSRTQPSTTSVMTCMVRSTSILPSASRGGSIASVTLQLEAVAGIAHHADAVDRAFDVAGEPRDQRIGAGAAAEECHRHARDRILIDQHGDMRAALQRIGKLDRRIHAGRDQRAHAAGAHRDDRVGDGRHVGPAVEHGGVDAVGCARRPRRAPSSPDARRTSAPACRRRAAGARSVSLSSESHDAARAPCSRS